MPNVSKNKIRRSYCFKEIHINNGRSSCLFLSIETFINFSSELVEDFTLPDYNCKEHS